MNARETSEMMQKIVTPNCCPPPRKPVAVRWQPPVPGVRAGPPRDNAGIA